MPAIQLSRLNAQVVELATYFEDPKKFLLTLHNLLDFYADRTLRPGSVVEASPLLHSYQVAKPVLRQIERELIPHTQANPDQALALVDHLWQERWLETRLLAISILSHIPPDPVEHITDRVQEWAIECKEDQVVKLMASKGIERLRTEARDHYIDLLDAWFTSEEHGQTKAALLALPALITIDGFENLPLVYRWIAPLVRNVELEFRDLLVEIVVYLVKRSPQETAYFVRQAITSAENPQTAKLIRQTLEEFPEELKSGLLDELREQRDLG